MTTTEELQHWQKAERYFSKANWSQILSTAKYYLFIKDHYVPCRCSDVNDRLWDGIEHKELFRSYVNWVVAMEYISVQEA